MYRIHVREHGSAGNGPVTFPELESVCCVASAEVEFGADGDGSGCDGDGEIDGESGEQGASFEIFDGDLGSTSASPCGGLDRIP